MNLIKTCLTVLSLTLATSAFASEIGDDGLHKADWMRDTFKDLGDDLAEANAEGKRLMLIVEQRGCIYCKKMHEEVFPLPNIDAYLKENYFVVQINMFGDIAGVRFNTAVKPFIIEHVSVFWERSPLSESSWHLVEGNGFIKGV